MRSEKPRHRPPREHGLDARALGVVAPDRPRSPHPGDRHGPARGGTLGGDERVVARRRLREPGEERRFGNAQLRGRRAEVEVGRRADAHRRLSEVDAVEVLLEDLLLVEVPLEAHGPERLARLPAPSTGDRTEQPGELHRDRRRPGHDPAGEDVVARGPRDGAEIDPVVLPEPPILHRDERDDEIGVDVGERNPAGAAAVARARRAEDHSVSILDADPRRGIAAQDVRGNGPDDPPRRREGDGAAERAERDEKPPRDPSHRGGRSVTVKVPPSLRPCTAGLYISSACAGGRTKTPGVVARAT